MLFWDRVLFYSVFYRILTIFYSLFRAVLVLGDRDPATLKAFSAVHGPAHGPSCNYQKLDVPAVIPWHRDTATRVPGYRESS